jgi:acyl carrier protein
MCRDHTVIKEAATILSDLRRRVAARIGVAELVVSVDATIIGGLGLASVDVLELLMEIEEEYPELDLENPAARELRTLDDLANWLAARRGRPQS